MNDQTPTSAQRAEALQGMGCKRKRVEDIRFVQGKGNYVDDLRLPGMLYGDFTRSPHGHARIKKIDTTKADWQFTTKNARIKLKPLYPAI